MNRILLLIVTILITGCTMKKEQVDLLVKDATIYTIDEKFSTVEAFVVKDGHIFDTGTRNLDIKN